MENRSLRAYSKGWGRLQCDVLLARLSPQEAGSISARWSPDEHTKEHVGHNDKVAIGSKLIRDQLGIDESVANDIGDKENRLLSGLVFGVGEVRLDWKKASAIGHVVVELRMSPRGGC